MTRLAFAAALTVGLLLLAASVALHVGDRRSCDFANATDEP